MLRVVYFGEISSRSFMSMNPIRTSVLVQSHVALDVHGTVPHIQIRPDLHNQFFLVCFIFGNPFNHLRSANEAPLVHVRLDI